MISAVKIAVGISQLLCASLLEALETQIVVDDTDQRRPTNVRLTRDFADCSMAVWLVFLAQHQVVNKVNVIGGAGSTSSVAVVISKPIKKVIVNGREKLNRFIIAQAP